MSDENRYRTEIGIVGDILNIIASTGSRGILISTMGKRARISHVTAKAKCFKLIEGELVQPGNGGRFTITQKGLLFSKQWERFRGLAAGYGLHF